MVGQLLRVVLYSFPLQEGQTGLGDRRVVCPTPTWGPLLLAVPSETKANKARREMGGVTNSDMVLYSIPFLPKKGQRGLGEG